MSSPQINFSTILAFVESQLEAGSAVAQVPNNCYQSIGQHGLDWLATRFALVSPIKCSRQS